MRRLPWEVEAVLALIVLDGIAVISTYSRVRSSELYHFHRGATVAGGLGRELVALNFPFALVGIALVGLAWPRLHRGCEAPAFSRSCSAPSSTSRSTSRTSTRSR